jgi:hypothetical protein
MKDRIDLGNALQIIFFKEKGMLFYGASPHRHGNHVFVTTYPRRMDRRKRHRVYYKQMINIFTVSDLNEVDIHLERNQRHVAQRTITEFQK